MQRQRKIFWGKTVAILATVPILLWAHAFGPDAGYANVPGENGNCTAAGCHVGTGLNAGGGSVAIAFPQGQTYSPGVTQHLTVTIADPATTQKRWGFQATARTSSNSKTMAGSFTSTDLYTTSMCAAVSNLGNFRELQFGQSQ